MPGRPFVRLTNKQLAYIAAGLGYLVAALHLFHPTLGFGRLALLIAVNPGLLLTDPRPIAFVLSGIALLIAVPAVSYGVPKKPVYVLGAVLMVTYIVGYLAWHLSGHGGFLPGREPLYHGVQPHEAVISHLTGNPWAATAIVTEITLLGILFILYSREA